MTGRAIRDLNPSDCVRYICEKILSKVFVFLLLGYGCFVCVGVE